MERPVIRRTESQATGAGRAVLFRREWRPRDPERVLLLVHGLAEHSGRYEHVGSWFAARGSAVHAYDQRGHGKSSGARGHLQNFDEYLDDLDRMLRLVRDLHPGLPIFLVGHSMGGLVVAAFLRERQPELAGAATSGAALRLSESVSRVSISAARALALVAPRLRMKASIETSGLSRSPEVVRAYEEDPLVFERITVCLARELFRAVQRTACGAADVRLPMLLLHGEADPICPVEGSRDFYAQLPPSSRELRTYPGLLHEIFNEPERETVFGDLLSWVRGLKG